MATWATISVASANAAAQTHGSAHSRSAGAGPSGGPPSGPAGTGTTQYTPHVSSSVVAHVMDSAQKRDIILKLMAAKGNGVCGDCGAATPQHLSVTFGVFLCNACANAHRGILLETASIDEKDADISKLQEVGGNRGNGTYEFGLKAAEKAAGKRIKPSPDSSEAVRKAFLRKKYNDMEWWSPAGTVVPKLADDSPEDEPSPAPKPAAAAAPAAAPTHTRRASAAKKPVAAPATAPKPQTKPKAKSSPAPAPAPVPVQAPSPAAPAASDPWGADPFGEDPFDAPALTPTSAAPASVAPKHSGANGVAAPAPAPAKAAGLLEDDFLNAFGAAAVSQPVQPPASAIAARPAAANANGTRGSLIGGGGGGGGGAGVSPAMNGAAKSSWAEFGGENLNALGGASPAVSAAAYNSNMPNALARGAVPSAAGGGGGGGGYNLADFASSAGNRPSYGADSFDELAAVAAPAGGANSFLYASNVPARPAVAAVAAPASSKPSSSASAFDELLAAGSGSGIKAANAPASARFPQPKAPPMTQPVRHGDASGFGGSGYGQPQPHPHQPAGGVALPGMGMGMGMGGGMNGLGMGNGLGAPMGGPAYGAFPPYGQAPAQPPYGGALGGYGGGAGSMLGGAPPPLMHAGSLLGLGAPGGAPAGMNGMNGMGMGYGMGMGMGGAPAMNGLYGQPQPQPQPGAGGYHMAPMTQPVRGTANANANATAAAVMNGFAAFGPAPTGGGAPAPASGPGTRQTRTTSVDLPQLDNSSVMSFFNSVTKSPPPSRAAGAGPAPASGGASPRVGSNGPSAGSGAALAAPPNPFVGKPLTPPPPKPDALNPFANLIDL